jgi:methylated-DNA-[protein]-cysteine S-methyltransferase
MTALPETLAERIAAAAVAEGLADAVYAELSSPIGRLLVVQSGTGVCRIGFEDEDPDAALAEVAALIGPRVVRSRARTVEVRDALSAYLEGGEPLELAADLRLVRAPFRREALEALRRVGHGETVTYS